MVSMVFLLLKEVILASVAKIAFRVVLERFFTRMVIYSLEKLRDYSTNEVVDGTVQDVIDSLKGKRLKVMDDKQ